MGVGNSVRITIKVEVETFEPGGIVTYIQKEKNIDVQGGFLELYIYI